MINIEIHFSREANKFLDRNKSRISEAEVRNAVIAAVRQTTREEDNSADVKRLHGKFKGFFRVRIGDIRIIYSVRYGAIHIASVSTIDFRGSVY